MDIRNYEQYIQQSLKKTPPKKGGIDPSAWISEIGGVVGSIPGIVTANPALAAGGAAAGSGLGKILEQRVKGEDVKGKDVLTEAALSGLFTYGPIKATKGLLGIAKTGVAGGVKGAAKGEVAKKTAAQFTGKQRTGITQVGEAWGIMPGTKQAGAKALTVAGANDYQNFLTKIGVPKTANAVQALDISDVFSKQTAKQISDKLVGTTRKFDKATFSANLRKAFEKALGAGQMSKVVTKQGAVKTAAGGTIRGQVLDFKGPKFNQFVDDIFTTLNKNGNTHEDLWKLRQLVDKQMNNFAKGVDTADTTAQSLGRLARTEINKILKEDPVIGKTFADYSKIQNIIDLVGPAAKAPKGTVMPGTGLRVFGPTTQRAKAGVGNLLKGEAGEKVTKEAVEEVPASIRRQISGVGLRQLAAAGVRPRERAVPTGEEQAIDTGIETGIGMETGMQEAAMDPRLPQVAAAIQQDIQTTGGKNLKNIQILAGLYGIDLSPIGLGTQTKSALDATTKRNLAAIMTAGSILSELEGQFTSAGGAQGRIGGFAQVGLGKVGLSPNVQAYRSLRAGYMSRIARSLGEVGVLTDADVQRALRLVPDVTDTEQEAQIKFESLRQILQDSYNTINQAGRL